MIQTKSGRRFPKDKDDWKLMFSNISDKLKKLEGYSIVVFTNQKNKVIFICCVSVGFIGISGLLGAMHISSLNEFLMVLV